MLDLGALKFDGFFSYTLYKTQSNNEYNSH